MNLHLRIVTLSILLTLPKLTTAFERAELLPPNAKMHISVSDTTRFLDALQESPIGKLWQDRQFQDFIGNPDAESWQELFFNGENDAEDQVFLEQIKMLNGELVLALDMDTEHVYIVAAMSKADFERSLELDEKLINVAEDTFKVVKSSFQDVEIIQHIENPDTPEASSSWQAHLDNTFVLGYTREWVEECIVRLRKNTVTEPTGNPVCKLNLPIAEFIRADLSKSNNHSSRTVMEALGLLGIDSLTARLELQNEQMLVDNRLQVSDLERGLFTLLDTEPSELPTVTFIPENIASLEVGRFNLLGLWQEIPVFLSTAQPQFKPQFDMMLGMLQQQTGINLEQDLLAHLGTQYLAFSTVEGDLQSSVVAVELNDGTAFRQGLDRALSAPGMQPYVASGIEITDFLDHTIYTLKNASPTDTMGIALLDDYLLYGTPGGLRQVIRSETSEAAANTTFEQSVLVKELRKQVPPRAFGFSAIDWQKNMAVILAELSKPEMQQTVRERWARSGSPIPPPNFEKLPPSDHIASFFNLSFQYVEEDRDGLHQQIILKY